MRGSQLLPRLVYPNTNTASPASRVKRQRRVAGPSPNTPLPLVEAGVRDAGLCCRTGVLAASPQKGRGQGGAQVRPGPPSPHSVSSSSGPAAPPRPSSWDETRGPAHVVFQGWWWGRRPASRQLHASLESTLPTGDIGRGGVLSRRQPLTRRGGRAGGLVRNGTAALQRKPVLCRADGAKRHEEEKEKKENASSVTSPRQHSVVSSSGHDQLSWTVPHAWIRDGVPVPEGVPSEACMGMHSYLLGTYSRPSCARKCIHMPPRMSLSVCRRPCRAFPAQMVSLLGSVRGGGANAARRFRPPQASGMPPDGRVDHTFRLLSGGWQPVL